MKNLTKAEEQIMQVIWKLDKAFLREIMDELPENNLSVEDLEVLLKQLKKK